MQDQGEAIAHTMTAQRSNARIEGLKAGTPYVVQVRARTVAGYGRYSSPADFSTNLQSMLLVCTFVFIKGCSNLGFLLNKSTKKAYLNQTVINKLWGYPIFTTLFPFKKKISHISMKVNC